MKKIKIKSTKIHHKKLGQQQAIGTADINTNTIEIDERLKGKKHLHVAIHEVLHLLNWDWSETKIDEQSLNIAKILWKLNYRRVDNTEKQPVI